MQKRPLETCETFRKKWMNGNGEYQGNHAFCTTLRSKVNVWPSSVQSPANPTIWEYYGVVVDKLTESIQKFSICHTNIYSGRSPYITIESLQKQHQKRCNYPLPARTRIKITSCISAGTVLVVGVTIEHSTPILDVLDTRNNEQYKTKIIMEWHDSTLWSIPAVYVNFQNLIGRNLESCQSFKRINWYIGRYAFNKVNHLEISTSGEGKWTSMKRWLTNIWPNMFPDHQLVINWTIWIRSLADQNKRVTNMKCLLRNSVNFTKQHECKKYRSIT